MYKPSGSRDYDPIVDREEDLNNVTTSHSNGATSLVDPSQESTFTQFENDESGLMSRVSRAMLEAGAVTSQDL